MKQLSYSLDIDKNVIEWMSEGMFAKEGMNRVAIGYVSSEEEYFEEVFANIAAECGLCPKLEIGVFDGITTTTSGLYVEVWAQVVHDYVHNEIRLISVNDNAQSFPFQGLRLHINQN